MLVLNCAPYGMFAFILFMLNEGDLLMLWTTKSLYRTFVIIPCLLSSLYFNGEWINRTNLGWENHCSYALIHSPWIITVNWCFAFWKITPCCLWGKMIFLLDSFVILYLFTSIHSFPIFWHSAVFIEISFNYEQCNYYNAFGIKKILSLALRAYSWFNVVFFAIFMWFQGWFGNLVNKEIKKKKRREKLLEGPNKWVTVVFWRCMLLNFDQFNDDWFSLYLFLLFFLSSLVFVHAVATFHNNSLIFFPLIFCPYFFNLN